MRTRPHLIVFALLAVTAVLFCLQRCGKKPDANDEAVPEESPVVASHRSFWLNAAHHSTCQVEDPLIRDALLLRLLPYCVRAGDTAFACQILEKVEDKASAHVEYAVAARRSNDFAAYGMRMGFAFNIADETREEDGSYDYDHDRSRIYRAIASTLIEAGYVKDAVLSISTRISPTIPDWDYLVLDLFDENVRELVSGGRIADARYIAAAIPLQRYKIGAYLEIAEIQRDDGQASGATRTLQEALAHVSQSASPVDKAYCFSLIAAAFAQNGDNTEAIDARTRCHRVLTAVDTGRLQESDDRATAARAYAKLAHTSCLLEEPEEAKRRLAQADSILAEIDEDWAKDEARADIAEVWMCMNEQDTALAVAEAQRDPDLKAEILFHVITYPSFSATPEVTDHILAGMPDDENRNRVLGWLAGHHSDHGRVTQAQVLAETISDSFFRDWAYRKIIEKHCELGSIEQAIDIAARIDDRDDAHNRAIIEKLCQLGSIEQLTDIAARIDDRDWAYSAIIEKHCELGSIEQAIDIAASRIESHWEEMDAFQLIGKTLAKSRSIAELESFLASQSNPIRLSAAYLGVVEALATNSEPNNTLDTDEDSAAPPPDQ